MQVIRTDEFRPATRSITPARVPSRHRHRHQTATRNRIDSYPPRRTRFGSSLPVDQVSMETEALNAQLRPSARPRQRQHASSAAQSSPDQRAIRARQRRGITTSRFGGERDHRCYALVRREACRSRYVIAWTISFAELVNSGLKIVGAFLADQEHRGGLIATDADEAPAVYLPRRRLEQVVLLLGDFRQLHSPLADLLRRRPTHGPHYAPSTAGPGSLRPIPRQYRPHGTVKIAARLAQPVRRPHKIALCK